MAFCSLGCPDSGSIDNLCQAIDKFMKSELPKLYTRAIDHTAVDGIEDQHGMFFGRVP